ncbi:MAG: bifunctional phosphoribosyl-AMP cyclohydrolase/phosphoribosyl-ATP diphosphatase HisIE [bacterium]|nr:bifunctional phosphoribosyl-AMP cyclohydrolase/phosphoribosyl-ATP diphosphatase HisIE [bacterium]
MSGITYDKDDLVTGVIQDADTGRVLMVGYLNAESLRLTKETGRVHFWSRSRSELWEKGATSGNYLNLVSIEQDCDSDALLISARPEGPTCHTGSTSCFGELDLQGFAQLEELWLTIGTRIAVPTPESYTARLVEAGPDLTGRKLVEEATETLIAAKNHAHGENDDVRVAEEAADVAYHLLVLLAERGIPAATVLEELRRRSV